MVNYHIGSPTALPAPGRQIFGYPPTSGSKTILTRILLCRLFLVASSLLPHLAHFLARPVGRLCFRLTGNWIVGLAIGRAKSRGADADSFHLIFLIVAQLKLWLILMACFCYLDSALTNTNDILKVAFADLLSGSRGSLTVPSPQLL